MLAMPNLQRPFGLETGANGYALGEKLMQGGRLMCCHFELFHREIFYYPMSDEDTFAIVQAVKKWKHYLFGKETIIHTDHYPFQYLRSHRKM